MLVAAFRRFSREGESHDDDPRFSRLLIAFSPEIGIGQVIRRVVTLVSVSLREETSDANAEEERFGSSGFRGVIPFRLFLIWKPLLA